MGYLSHPYAWRLRSASFAGATIERLQYRDTLDVVIRFADWRGRRFQPKALEIGEDELLVLIGDAIAADVLSSTFVRELKAISMTPTKKALKDAEKLAYVEKVRNSIAEAHIAALEAGNSFIEKAPKTIEGHVRDSCGGAYALIYGPSRRFLNALKACDEADKDYRGGWVISNFTKNIKSQSYQANQLACQAACEVLHQAFPEEPKFFAHSYET